ncbi:class I SAM-dependent methyltransferase [Pelagibacteraceae bacterium]|nr:class I SAM-dependent methyltransferase [Pelagibacteraceae bacterium]
MEKKILDQQSQYWEKNFLSKPEMFGLEPSKAAINTLKIFKEENIKKIIELGAGLGRDTIFFAKNSINVEALDYSPTAIKIINKKVLEHKLSNVVSTKMFDVRKKLPFKDNSVNACFSHMLYCMALTTTELKYLNSEICRVLKPGGINVYTVRHTEDGDYKNGIHIGEDLYENDGFIVHFFSKEKVRKISDGFNVINIESFEEGKFPRKLFRAVLKKK